MSIIPASWIALDPPLFERIRVRWGRIPGMGLCLLALLLPLPSAAADGQAASPVGESLPAAGKEEEPCYQSPWLASFVCQKPVISKVAYPALKQRLTDYIETLKKDGILIDAGLYFRDLEGGPHFGVNEYANFAAGSLLKLPLVIQYLGLAEQDPGLLKLKLVVPEGMDLLYSVHYLPPETLKPRKGYRIEDLLFRTVAYSDNVAFLMLRQFLVHRYGNESFIWESYRHLGLVPDITDKNYVISVSRYASMFNVLYRASYLGPELSEKLIGMLRVSKFKSGLVAGVPSGTEVAHKFGEFEADGVVQLNDCGIVYFPGNPYLLCVMSRGKSYEELEKVIAEISRIIYAEVDSRRVR